MTPLKTITFSSPTGEKTISVYNADITSATEHIDVMTISAFAGDYIATERSVIGALNTVGISVSSLSKAPEIDLRGLCNVWLSLPTGNVQNAFRIGCIEFDPLITSKDEKEEKILISLKAYFQMLSLAEIAGIATDVISLPLLGSGDQNILPEFILIPILNECVAYLKRSKTKKICFIERNAGKAELIAEAVEKSYSLIKEEMAAQAMADMPKKYAFISYSTVDKNIADNLASKLEREGIKVWYAPRDVISSDYATAIVTAITKCTHFIVIVSKNGQKSQHVLNEIDLAFKELNRNVKIMPLRVDDDSLQPAFNYYLSRQHWMDAHVPPIEIRLNEFVERIKQS